MRSSKLTMTTALGLCAVFALPAPVVAQEVEAPVTAGAEEDEVVVLGNVLVTARRREERLSDVPTAASIIDGEALASRGGAATSGELLADQPSVRFNNLNSSITSEISIRASSTARATNGDPSVGLYRNGAYIGGGGIGGRNFSKLDFLDIGRVEVLRGTQGALYGRNAVGGAVNIVSAQPEFEQSGFLNGRYGIENKSRQVQGAYNTALTDTFAIRVSGEVVDQEDGFFYNRENDVFFDQQDGHALRGQARYSKGPIDFVLLAETQELTTPAIHYQLAIAPGTPGFPGGYTQDQYQYPWNTPPRAQQDVTAYQGLLKVDLGWANLTSTTQLRERTSEYDLDNDAVNPAELARARAAGQVGALTPVDPNGASYVLDTTESFLQDINLSGDLADGRLDWLLGVDVLILESNYSVETVRTPTLLNASTGSFAPAKLNYDSYAVYGSLGYDLTERLNLTGELRFTNDDRSLSARLFDRVTGVPLGGAARVIDTSLKSENLSYNATVSYAITEDVLAYAKAGTSYRAGGFNTNLGDPRQPTPIDAAFDDETSTSYELGLKGTLPGNAYFAIAAYSTEQQDLIAQTDNGCAVTNPACPVAATSFLTNAGDASAYGVEAEVSSYFDIGNGRLFTALSGSTQSGEVDSGRFAGLDLAQVPEYLASATIDYRHPVGENAELFGNLVYTSQSGGKQELRATSVNLDDYQLVNARAGFKFGNGVRLTFFAQNLFDEVYRVARDTTINRYNQPQLTGIEIGYSW